MSMSMFSSSPPPLHGLSSSAPTLFLIVGRSDKCLCFPFEAVDNKSIHGFMLVDDEMSSLADCVKNLKLQNNNCKDVVVVLERDREMQIIQIEPGTTPPPPPPLSRSWPAVLELGGTSLADLYQHCLIGQYDNTLEDKQTLVSFLQDNCDVVSVSTKAAEHINLDEWATMWFHMSTGYPGFRMMLKFVNWELNGVFHYPHRKQEKYLCWLYTMCDQLEAFYTLKHPDKQPIKISKQYVLDHIPVDENKKPIGSAFTYKLDQAYRWVANNFLVLEQDYSKYEAVRCSPRPIKGGPKLTIRDLTQYQGHEQEAIDKALLEYPIAASIWAKNPEMLRLNANPDTPYVIDDVGGKLGSINEVKKAGIGNKHAVVLSGMISSPFSHLDFVKDSYFVKDPEFLAEKGRFFMKKRSSVLPGEINPLFYVIFPKQIYLG